MFSVDLATPKFTGDGGGGGGGGGGEHRPSSSIGERLEFYSDQNVATIDNAVVTVRTAVIHKCTCYVLVTGVRLRRI